MSFTHQTAKTSYLAVGDTTYAYRRFGREHGVPLVFLQHFRGTMDHWDPLLINNIASSRPVILVDNAGVGQSTGTVPDNVPEMAAHIITFVTALKLTQVDLLGFSLGGYIGQLVVLNGPKNLVRKLILAGTSPSAGEGILDHPPDRQARIGELAADAEVGVENMKELFFKQTPSSQKAGEAYWARINERQKPTSGEQRSDFVSSGYKDGGAGVSAMGASLQKFKDIAQRGTGSFDRLGEINIPVLIGQGHDDFMIPTVNSFTAQQLLPDARLKIFPDSSHGFLFQFAEEFALDVTSFLSLP